MSDATGALASELPQTADLADRLDLSPGHCVVVGLQWGDEGKGKIVDLLARRYDVVARYNGGANAGHTVVVGKGEMRLIGGHGDPICCDISTSMGDVWTSTDGLNWSEVTEQPQWGNRTFHTSLFFHDKVWLLGGISAFGSLSGGFPKNDVWFTNGNPGLSHQTTAARVWQTYR